MKPVYTLRSFSPLGRARRAGGLAPAAARRRRRRRLAAALAAATGRVPVLAARRRRRGLASGRGRLPQHTKRCPDDSHSALGTCNARQASRPHTTDRFAALLGGRRRRRGLQRRLVLRKEGAHRRRHAVLPSEQRARATNAQARGGPPHWRTLRAAACASARRFFSRSASAASNSLCSFSMSEMSVAQRRESSCERRGPFSFLGSHSDVSHVRARRRCRVGQPVPATCAT